MEACPQASENDLPIFLAVYAELYTGTSTFFFFFNSESSRISIVLRSSQVPALHLNDKGKESTWLPEESVRRDRIWVKQSAVEWSKSITQEREDRTGKGMCHEEEKR